MTAPDLTRMAREVDAVHAAPPLLDYVQVLARATREHPALEAGLSPRALLALLSVSRAWAYLHGRAMVLPEDIQAVFAPLCAHRLPLRDAGVRVQDVIDRVLADTPIP